MTSQEAPAPMYIPLPPASTPLTLPPPSIRPPIRDWVKRRFLSPNYTNTNVGQTVSAYTPPIQTELR